MRKSDIPCFSCEHGKDNPKLCRHTCERWKEYEARKTAYYQANAEDREFNSMMVDIERQRYRTYKTRKSRKDGRKN